MSNRKTAKSKRSKYSQGLLRRKPPVHTPLHDAVRKAYITKREQCMLSDSPITLVVLHVDNTHHCLFFWPANEAIGLHVLSDLEGITDIGEMSELANALLTFAVPSLRRYFFDEDEDLICKTFGVKTVSDLGLILSDENMSFTKLNPVRHTVVLYVY